jgi:ankyrin repeat protein
VDGLDHDGLPLAMALRFANLDCVEALITRGARLANIVFSAAAGRVDQVRAYLDEGDAVTIEAASALPLSRDRKTAAEQALVFASMCGRIETVRLLVERGVDINASPPGSHRTATPLHSAALQGQVSLIGFLLDKGADPTIKDARYQGTPLGWTSHARGARKALAQQAAILLSERS